MPINLDNIPLVTALSKQLDVAKAQIHDRNLAAAVGTLLGVMAVMCADSHEDVVAAADPKTGSVNAACIIHRFMLQLSASNEETNPKETH